MNFITENTLIPIISLPFMFGGIAWITNIYNQGRRNKEELEEVKLVNSKIFDKLDEMNNNYNGINERLSKIEGQLTKE